MSTLLISATTKEIEPLLKMSRCKQLSINTYKWNKLSVKITGIGLLETAINLSSALKPSINKVIQVGVAGSYNHRYELGDLVEVTSEQYGDLGAESQNSFLSISEIGLSLPNYFDNNKIHNSAQFEYLANVDSISVNSVAGKQSTIDLRTLLYQPDIENMEGLALFRVCKENNIEFAQVRAISNYVVPRNRESWRMDLAINNLNEFIRNQILS